MKITVSSNEKDIEKINDLINKSINDEGYNITFSPLISNAAENEDTVLEFVSFTDEKNDRYKLCEYEKGELRQYMKVIEDITPLTIDDETGWKINAKIENEECLEVEYINACALAVSTDDTHYILKIYYFPDETINNLKTIHLEFVLNTTECEINELIKV